MGLGQAQGSGSRRERQRGLEKVAEVGISGKQKPLGLGGRWNGPEEEMVG